MTPGQDTVPTWRRWVRLFYLDLRSLALFRIGLALVILVDLIDRAAYGGLVGHYTDQGAVPRHLVVERLINDWNICLHTAVGGSVPVAGLFLLHGAAAVLLLLGWRTRWLTFVCWLLAVSLQHRNTLVLNAGDTLLRLLLFWGMFLPLGARASLDWLRRQALDPGHASSNRLVSTAGAALILQICLLYWFTAAYKSGSTWAEGHAVAQTLALDAYVKPGGVWLRQQESLLPWITHATFWWEFMGPVFLLAPWRNTLLRSLAVAGFLMLHLGFLWTIEIGMFPWITVVAWLVFIPSAWWNWLNERRTIKASSPLLLPLTLSSPARWMIRHARVPVVRPTWLNHTLAALAFAYVLVWNINGFKPGWKHFRLPQSLRPIAYVLRLDQKWNMFAPNPTSVDGWFVIDAKLINGERVNLLRNGQPLSFDRPKHLADTMPNRRWGKFWWNIRLRKHSQHRLWLGKYLARTWNLTHDYEHQVTEFKIYLVRNDYRRDGPRQPRQVELWHHRHIAPRKRPPQRSITNVNWRWHLISNQSNQATAPK